jgi:hypothetical protein
MELSLVPFEHSTVPLVVADIPAGGKVSKVIIEAGETFALSTGLDPQFAWIRVIPAGAQEFVEVRGMTLIQADWVPAGQVAVGRGGIETVDEKYKRWKTVSTDLRPANYSVGQIIEQLRFINRPRNME